MFSWKRTARHPEAWTPRFPKPKAWSSVEKEQAPASEDVVAFSVSSCEEEVLGLIESPEVEEIGRACDVSETLQRGVLLGPVCSCRCVSGPCARVVVVWLFCLDLVSFSLLPFTLHDQLDRRSRNPLRSW